MKISFDGARRNLARCFNELAETKLTQEQAAKMQDLRMCIGAFLCMYDDTQENFHDLSETVDLVEIPDQRQPSDCSIPPAKIIEHLKDLCDYAYEHGYHELGYDPVKEVAALIQVDKSIS